MDSKIRTLRGGKRLFIEDSDPSSALPVLVCLHGLGSSTTFYEASLALSHLASTHRLIRYDMDGHGLSPVSGEDVSIASLVEDLVRVLEFSGVGGPVSLVGHSMGGAVALTFSALYLRRVSSLLLLGPVPSLPPAGITGMQLRASTIRTSGLSSIVGAVVSGATSAHTKLHSPLSLSLIRALVLGTSIEGYARAALALASAEGREWSAVQAETLIVGGEEDYMCTKELCERLVGEIEGSRTVEMKGVGHWMAVEAPKRTADIMRDFFVVN